MFFGPQVMGKMQFRIGDNIRQPAAIFLHQQVILDPGITMRPFPDIEVCP